MLELISDCVLVEPEPVTIDGLGDPARVGGEREGGEMGDVG